MEVWFELALGASPGFAPRPMRPFGLALQKCGEWDSLKCGMAHTWSKVLGRETAVLQKNQSTSTVFEICTQSPI